MLSRAFFLAFQFAVFSFLAAPHFAFPAEFVVDARNPQASDDNPGTKDKPLKTISAAATRVKAGDHVVIHGGEYRETVIIKASGTPEAPIVFEAGPGEPPVIKGSEVVTGWQRVRPNVWKANLPPSPAISPREDDPTHWVTSDVRQVFVRANPTSEALHLRPSALDAMRDGNYFCDNAKAEIYIWLPESADPNRLTIEASVRANWLYVTGSNVIVRNLQMRHSSTLAFGIGA